MTCGGIFGVSFPVVIYCRRKIKRDCRNAVLHKRCCDNANCDALLETKTHFGIHCPTLAVLLCYVRHAEVQCLTEVFAPVVILSRCEHKTYWTLNVKDQHTVEYFEEERNQMFYK